MKFGNAKITTLQMMWEERKQCCQVMNYELCVLRPELWVMGKRVTRIGPSPEGRKNPKEEKPVDIKDGGPGRQLFSVSPVAKKAHHGKAKPLCALCFRALLFAT